MWFKKKTKEERIIELKANIRAWEETWSNHSEITFSILSRYEAYKADLYKIELEEDLEKS